MPQTYPSEQPHRRSSSASMLDNMGLTSLDVDDSIVLSDLLRTGEASRLRRRGAMRIDHNHPHPATSGGHVLRPPRLSSPNIVLVERTSWDSDSDLESPSFTSHWNIDSPNRFSRRHHPSSRRFGPHDSSGIGSSSQGEYILVCGSEVTNSESNHVEPFIPSILPLYPPPSASASITKKAVKKSTGCGTIVHMHAAPRSRFRMWTARTPASETVVPLDACYFDAKEANRFKRSQCGCVNEGVGCAVCGNLLGTRYTPCKSASEGFRCSRLQDKQPSTSASPTHHESSSPKSLHSKPNRCVYTFFSDAVTPTPSFSFPPPPVRPARSRSTESRPVSPLASPPFVPPERYLYSPYDEEEESDSENYPPYIADNSAGWGSQAINSVVFPSTFATNLPVPMSPPSHGPASVPRDGILDRFVDSPPASMLENQTNSQAWGINPPSPSLPLRTRTGRVARWSSIGRSFPSLSSGLGSMMPDERPISPISFFDRQLMVASERETRDGQLGDAIMTDSTNDPSPTQGGLTVLNLDGEMVAWDGAASGTDTYVHEVDDEYKPGYYFFDR